MTHGPALVAFAAPSGTGKTTLIAAVCERLRQLGLSVVAVKHDAHRVELDTEGKDSWRLRQAGADTLLVADGQVGWFTHDKAEPPPITDLIGVLAPDSDVVLLEGFRDLGVPTVLVGPRSDPSWSAPGHANVIADLDRNDVGSAVAIVLRELHQRRTRPTIPN